MTRFFINKLKERWRHPKFRKKVGIGFTLIIISFIILFSLTDPTIIIPPQKIKKSADFEFEKVTITFLESGISSWKLTANKASIYNDNNLTELETVKGLVYNDEKPIVHFDAPKAHFNLDSSNIKLHQAHATIDSKTRSISVYADILSWFSEKRLFIGKENTSIKTKGLALFGDYFKVDVPFQKLILSDHGKAIIKQNITDNDEKKD